MTVQCLPPRPLPPGQRCYMDVVREIEAAEGLICTGWHYAAKPDAAEVEYKARVHERCNPSDLVARCIDTGETNSAGWSLFRKAA